MKLHRYVDHQRLHIVTEDVISLSISVLLLFRHYISHKITFGAPSSGGVLCSACGAFICLDTLHGCSSTLYWYSYQMLVDFSYVFSSAPRKLYTICRPTFLPIKCYQDILYKLLTFSKKKPCHEENLESIGRHRRSPRSSF